MQKLLILIARHGDSFGDEAELSEDLLPFSKGDMFAVFQGGEEFCQLLLLVAWELQNLVNGVNDPPQDFFVGAPAAVSLQQLLEGHSFGMAHLITMSAAGTQVQCWTILGQNDSRMSAHLLHFSGECKCTCSLMQEVGCRRWD